jgi:signal transduction histidine kinase
LAEFFLKLFRLQKSQHFFFSLFFILLANPSYGAEVSCAKLDPKFTVEQVHNKKLLQDAELFAADEINFGYSNDRLWCKLPQGFLKEVLSIEYPLLDNVQLHVLNKNGWRTQQWGDLYPKDSELFSPYLYFLTKNREASNAVYLSIQSKSSLRIPIHAFTLEQYITRINIFNMFYSGFFSIVFVMGFFAIAMSITLGKDITYVYYTLCIFSAVVFYLNIFTGYINLQIFRDYTLFLQNAPAWATCMYGYFLISFFVEFVQFKKAGNSYRIWKFFCYLQLLFILLFFVIPYQVGIKLAILSGLIISISMIIHLLLIFKTNVRARIFLVSWVAFIVGTIYFTIATLGIIANSPVTEFGMQLGTLFQVFFLAIGLNTKLKEIHDEKKELSQHVVESFAEIKILDAKLDKSKESEEKYGKLIKDLSVEYGQIADKLDLAKSEQETVSKELAEASRQLIQAEKLSGLGAMVSGIAHDINNPLNFIETARFQVQEKLDQLKEHLLELVPEGEEGKEFKTDLLTRFEKLSRLNEQVKTGVIRVTEISKSMRNASRSDAKKTSDVNLVEVIQESLVITGNKVNQFQLNKNIYDGITFATCNRSQIGQVVMNFLSNAADALVEYKQQHNGHKGIIQVDLAISSQNKDQNEPKTVLISVSDNGAGVPKEHQDKVLEAFFTTKTAGVGTGLGLAICGKIAQAHEGVIAIEDGLKNGQGGHGAKFTLEFSSSGKK